MKLFKIALRNILDKPLNLLLSIILFSLGIGLISFLLLFNSQLSQKFESNLAEIDLVLGAKGSPLQLILCNMYHIDNPTGNIKIKDAAPFLNPKHPLIKNAVPLSLGDNYNNFRIVGTEHGLVDLYKGKIETGTLWAKDLDVTIGAKVAHDSKLKIGDKFVSSHGFQNDEDLAHDHSSFKVVGILAPSGTVLDQLILTNTASIWAVHAHEEDGNTENETTENGEKEKGQEVNENAAESHDHDNEHAEDHSHKANEAEAKKETAIVAENHDHAEEDGHDHAKGDDHDHVNEGSSNSREDLLSHPEESITSILIQYKSKTNFQSLSLPRNINENTALQAASPAYEINKLRDMVGVGTNSIRYIALLIAIVSAISIFISLLKSLQERKYELALMRVMGSSRSKLFYLILLEGILLSILGWIIGTVIAHAGMEILGRYLESDFRYNFSGMLWIKEEWTLLGVSLLIGIVSALIPAFKASNTDINKTLSKA